MQILTFILSSLFWSSSTVPDNPEIKVNIENVKSKKGVLIVALFNSEDNYLKKSYLNKVITLEDSKKPVVFENLPKGHYAVSVIHDENENGKLDTNWAGIPKEPFGFSKKSMGNFGPPSFNETSVEVSEGPVSTTVKMKTFL